MFGWMWDAFTRRLFPHADLNGSATTNLL